MINENKKSATKESYRSHLANTRKVGKRVRTLGLVFGAAVIMAACGTPADNTSPQDGATSNLGQSDSSAQPDTNADNIPDSQLTDTGEAVSSLDDVYKSLNGLEGPERTAKLVELAKREVENSGPLLWYTVTSQDDATSTVQAFSEKTGVAGEAYAASALDKRIEEEANAGQIKGDVIRLNQLELAHGVAEGWFETLQHSPVFDELKDGALHDQWAAEQMYAEVVTWNTNLVSEPPQSYTDLFTNYRDSNLGLSLKNADWLYAMVQILQEYEGHSEEEAIQLLRDAAKGFVPVESSSLSAELLAAGDYAVCATCLIYRNPRLIEDGAPIAFVPPVGPVPTKYSGIAIAKHATHPAGALLFLEWILSDGQQSYVDAGRTPTNKNYTGGVDNYPEITELYPIKYEGGVLEDPERWESLFQELVESSGKDAISSK